MNRTGDAGFDAVLFDLDGTLVDTAPDMVAVLMDLQMSEGLEPLPYDLARSHVSNGAAGLIRLAFPDAPQAYRERLHAVYLERYAASICVYSRLFPGLEALLATLDAASCPWGVVTNKPEYLTRPLLDGLALAERAACIVSGDTLPERKPHPAPLLLASDQAGVPAERCVYIGDAARDIEAGRAARMGTIAAAYGYVTGDDDPVRWQADHIATDTRELATIVQKAVNLQT